MAERKFTGRTRDRLDLPQREHAAENTTTHDPASFEGLEAAQAGQGGPRKWAKRTVVLWDDQARWLERVALDAKDRTGNEDWNRSMIMRAMIDGLKLSGVDIRQIQSESALAGFFAAKLRGE